MIASANAALSSAEEAEGRVETRIPETKVQTDSPEEPAPRIKVRIKSLDLFYGNFQALKDVTMDIAEKRVTALIGPSGCGKSTFLKCLNRMNDLIPGCRITGEVTIDDTDIYRGGIDVAYLRKEVGMVFQKPNPFEMSVFDNIAYGPRVHGLHDRHTLREVVEKSLRHAALWDEVKDRLHKSAMGALGRPAAAAVYRTRARGGTLHTADGRADLGIGPDIHGPNRGTDRGAEKGIHYHYRDAQYAAGGARVR